MVSSQQPPFPWWVRGPLRAPTASLSPLLALSRLHCYCQYLEILSMFSPLDGEPLEGRVSGLAVYPQALDHCMLSGNMWDWVGG